MCVCVCTHKTLTYIPYIVGLIDRNDWILEPPVPSDTGGFDITNDHMTILHITNCTVGVDDPTINESRFHWRSGCRLPQQYKG